MTADQEERLVVAFEQMAMALEGIHEKAEQAAERFCPKYHEPRQAHVSRVLTAEDQIREDQGAADTRPISQWLTNIGDEPGEPFIGEREQEFLRRQKAALDTKAAGQAG